MPSSKKPCPCTFCGRVCRSRREAHRHQKDCHMQPGRQSKPLHFGDLADRPFAIKSPYGGQR